MRCLNPAIPTIRARMTPKSTCTQEALTNRASTISMKTVALLNATTALASDKYNFERLHDLDQPRILLLSDTAVDFTGTDSPRSSHSRDHPIVAMQTSIYHWEIDSFCSDTIPSINAGPDAVKANAIFEASSTSVGADKSTCSYNLESPSVGLPRSSSDEMPEVSRMEQPPIDSYEIVTTSLQRDYLATSQSTLHRTLALPVQDTDRFMPSSA